MNEKNMSAIFLETSSFSVVYQDKKSRLSQTEYAIMYELIKKNGNVVTWDRLIKLIYPNPDKEPQMSAKQCIEVFIAHLRTKLGNVGLRAEVINIPKVDRKSVV